MNRDHKQFPDDENGNALWSMVEDGDDLEIEREVDFSVSFKTEEDALNFARSLLSIRQKVSLSDNDDEEFPIEITVHYETEPTYEAITEFEAVLEEYAAMFNGQTDGWSCYEEGDDEGEED